MSNKFVGIILAAGQGIRMRSAIPKVLHPVCGRPMLAYVLDLARKLRLASTFVVTGYRKELLAELLSRYKLRPIYQDKLLGTADAVKRTFGPLKNFKGNCLILYGDQPLLREGVLRELMKRHLATGAQATVLTARVKNPFGYGRLVRDNFSRIKAIVEEQDASDAVKAINEINTGIICFNKDSLFKAIKDIRPDNAKKEYYLTDAIKIMAEAGLTVESLSISSDVEQAQGINTQQDLAYAQKIMRQRILDEFMKNGVSILDPDTTHIDYDCKIGGDTVIYPFTVIEKGVIIGKFCSIGPFCHLRQGTIIEDKAVIGNFSEIVRSRLGKETLMKHFSYLGDATVGSKVNIGCGTITANFDGKHKQKTFIGSGALIGSDTVLRAPLRVGANAVTGAGAVVTKDVKSKTVVVGVPARPLKRIR